MDKYPCLFRELLWHLPMPWLLLNLIDYNHRERWTCHIMELSWQITIEACQSDALTDEASNWFDCWLQSEPATHDNVLVRLEALSSPVT